MAVKQDIYIVTHSSSEFKILGDYLKSIDSPAFPANVKNQQKIKKATNTDGEQTTEYNIDWQKYAKDFCGYIDNNEISNLNKIISRFSFEPSIQSQIDVLVKQKDYLNIPLRPGIRFAIPKQNIDKSTLLTQGLNVVTNEGAFKAKALYDLEKDTRYTPVNKLISNDSLSGSLKEMYPDMTIWLWCRSLSPQNKNLKEKDELQGQFFDITRFVFDIQTSVTKNGGNFQLRLAPIICKRDEKDGHWVIDKAYILENNEDFKKEFYSESQLNKIVSGIDENSYITSRNTFLFHNSISTNDVIFIRFETLEIEALKRIQDYQKGNTGFIDKNDLPNKIYDMIGLIDSNRLVVNPQNSEISIDISGRDLSKLFIEDGTYFYALENSQGVLNFAGGTSSKNEYTKRVTNDNSLLYLSLYFNNSIEKVLEFIINQLSTIKVVPDDLFIGYAGQNNSVLDGSGKSKSERYLPIETQNQLNVQNGNSKDRRNKSFQYTQDSKQALNKRKDKINNDITNVFNLIRNFRKKNNLSAKTSTGKIDQLDETMYVKSIYEKMHAFVNTITTPDDKTKLILAKFGNGNNSIKVSGKTVESGSTITGWLAVNQSNFQTQEDIIPSLFLDKETALFADNTTHTAKRVDENVGIINSIWKIIQEEQNLNDNLDQDVKPSNGIWQLVNLVIDSSVSSRRILDSSISSANGSLLNFIRKICQEPFVEFFMDTYGDQYYLIVRKPPFDQKAMIRYITGNVDTDQKDNVDRILDTENEDSTSLKQEFDLGHSTVIDIEDIDVIQENLYFDDSEVYSWYHFTPKGSFFGNAQQYSLAFIPAIFFDDYAEIWGSKPCDIINNYTPYVPQYSQDNKKLDVSTKQAFYDLKYMVETNQYMPFTRKGSITLNRDRRIKIGNPVRYKPTGEIFWVDAVSHTNSISVSSIDATTTIQVSRGMIEPFIKGKTGDELNKLFNIQSESNKFTADKIFSYFTIINTELNFKPSKSVPKYKDVDVVVSSGAPVYVKPNVNMSTGQTSTTGIQFIKLQEGPPQLIAKLDTAKNYAIGYGFNYNTDGSRIKKGQTASLDQVENLLRFHLSTFEKDVKMLMIFKPLTQNQFDAMVDLAYNGGRGAFFYKHSKYNNTTLRQSIIDFQNGAIDATRLTLIWGETAITSIKQGTVDVHFINPVLVKRRQQEVHLFLNQIVIDSTPDTIQTKQVFAGTEKIVDPDQVLNNFKVDKEIFNFFLRKQQLDYFNNN